MTKRRIGKIEAQTIAFVAKNPKPEMEIIYRACLTSARIIKNA